MYNSSAQGFKDFVDGNIWRDIRDDLDLWLEDIHESLEDPDDVLDDKQHAKLRGNAEAVRKFMLLPYIVHENIIEDQKEEAVTKGTNEEAKRPEEDILAMINNES